MARALFALSIFIQIGSLALAGAESCDLNDCSKIARFSLSPSGMAKLYEVVILNLLDQFKTRVEQRVQLRDVVVDRSKCPSAKLSDPDEVMNAECLGCPDLSSVDRVSNKGDVIFRPCKVFVRNARYRKMGLRLITPVTCDSNYRCDFKVGLADIDLVAGAEVVFTDTKQNALQPSDLSIKSNDNFGEVVYDFTVGTNPNGSGLTELFRAEPATSQFQVPVDSLKMSLNPQIDLDNMGEQIGRVDEFRRQYEAFGQALKDPDFVRQQIREAISEAWSQSRTLMYSKRRAAGYSNLCLDSDKARQKACDALTSKDEEDLKKKIAELESEEFFKKIQNTKMPPYRGGAASFDTLPAELWRLPATHLQKSNARDMVEAVRLGYNNLGSYRFTESVVGIANGLLSKERFINGFLNPTLQSNMGPAIVSAINLELQNLTHYWNQIAVAPVLDPIQDPRKLAGDIKDYEREIDRLKKEINAGELSQEDGPLVASQKERLLEVERRLVFAKEKLKNRFMYLDVGILVGKIDKAQGLTGYMYPNGNTCFPMPDLEPPSTSGHDLSTILGVESAQYYIDRMRDNGYINFCAGSDLPDCAGGTQLEVKDRPIISCDPSSGKLVMRFQNVNLTKIKMGVKGELRATLNNCKGSPCFHLSDGRGELRFWPAQLFFGGVLNQQMNEALEAGSHKQLRIPNMELMEVRPDPKTCQTRLNWKIHPPTSNHY